MTEMGMGRRTGWICTSTYLSIYPIEKLRFFFPSRQINLQYYRSRQVFKKLRKWAKRSGVHVFWWRNCAAPKRFRRQAGQRVKSCGEYTFLAQ